MIPRESQKMEVALVLLDRLPEVENLGKRRTQRETQGLLNLVVQQPDKSSMSRHREPEVDHHTTSMPS